MGEHEGRPPGVVASPALSLVERAASGENGTQLSGETAVVGGAWCRHAQREGVRTPVLTSTSPELNCHPNTAPTPSSGSATKPSRDMDMMAISFDMFTVHHAPRWLSPRSSSLSRRPRSSRRLDQLLAGRLRRPVLPGRRSLGVAGVEPGAVRVSGGLRYRSPMCRGSCCECKVVSQTTSDQYRR